MISVVMPAHNEAGYLGPAVDEVVSGLRARPEPFEVVIAENGSTDATAAQAAGLAGAYPEVSTLSLEVADYGAALRAGFLAAKGEVVVNFDVDLVDLGFLDRAVGLMSETGVAVVVGSKRAAGAEDQRTAARRLITATFGMILRAGFGLRISDTHGLKALRRSDLEPLVKECRFGKDIFDTELILRAERLGLPVSEIPVTVRDARPPRTPIARRIPRTLVGLVRLRLVLGPARRRASARRKG